MSDLGPCTTCGEPYESCGISDEDPEYTTDANGNHEGLCCADCWHPAADDGRTYAELVNAPLAPATVEALRAELASKDPATYRKARIRD